MTRPRGVPQRGEVWIVDFNPGRGHEQKGIRPALVIQDDGINRSPLGTTVILAVSKLTETKRRGILNVEIPRGEGGLRLDSVVKCHQVLTVDRRRLTRRLGRLSEASMRDVERGIRIVTGLPVR